MDYEKKYKEALEVMRQWIAPCHDAKQLEVLKKSVFPELRESEDERIRKYLVEELKAAKSVGELKFTIPQPTREECIAYLEKQKEQKPALKQTLDAYKISDERATAKMEGRIEGRQDVINNPEEYGLQKPAGKQDYSGLTDLERAIHRGFLSAGVENVPVAIIKETAQDCLAQMKPVEWSEEDERILYNVIAYVGYAAGERGVKDDDFKEANEWLRNLRSHSSWKPSEEQMNCLCAAVDAAIRKHNESVSGYKPARVLKSLYEQLQRLM